MKIIPISGVIGWAVEPSQIRDYLNEAAGEDVRIEINSPGGFIFPGLEIFNLIKGYEGNVECRIVGLAASMASYIALSGDTVTAEDNAVYMIHDARSAAAGTHREFTKLAKHLDSLSNMIAKAYVTQTGKKMSEVREMMKEETFLFGDEMLTHGFVDRMLESKKKKDKATAIIEGELAFAACMTTMRDMPEASNDIERAVALINGHKPDIGKSYLSDYLNRILDKKSEGSKEERLKLIDGIYESTSIDPNAVHKTLNGSYKTPSLDLLQIFSAGLDIPLMSLREMAEKDGMVYEEEMAIPAEVTCSIMKFHDISETEYEAAENFEPEAPYPNEHACRVREPGQFEKGSFRRISRRADGKKLSIIIGRLKGKDTTSTQAFRYPKDEWTAAQAREHCNRNKGKTFEPATAKGGCGGGT